MDVMRELAVFNKVTYYDEPHLYYIDGQQMISATTILGKYKNKFNSDIMAPKTGAKWANLYQGTIKFDKDFVQDIWKWLNLHAVTEGSIIHDYLENLFNNKVFPYPEQRVVDALGYDAISESYPILKGFSASFYEDVYQKLIPIKAELVVGDEELGICGMVDMLFWNEKAQCYQIWDWKTNTKLNMYSKYGDFMKAPIDHLEDCEFIHYSLQLSLYRYIIEKNTSIDLGTSYIVWFNEENDGYKVIECMDLRKEIKVIIEHYNKKTLKV